MWCTKLLSKSIQSFPYASQSGLVARRAFVPVCLCVFLLLAFRSLLGMAGHERLEALRSEKRALSDRISEALAEGKRLRRSANAKAKTAARAWNFNDFEDVRRVALIIHTLADFEILPAVVYLAGIGWQYHWQPELGPP